MGHSWTPTGSTAAAAGGDKRNTFLPVLSMRHTAALMFPNSFACQISHCCSSRSQYIIMHTASAAMLQQCCSSIQCFEQELLIEQRFSADVPIMFLPVADIEPRCGTIRPSMETNVLIAKTQLGKVRTCLQQGQLLHRTALINTFSQTQQLTADSFEPDRSLSST
jgi:hypothetical protein